MSANETTLRRWTQQYVTHLRTKGLARTTLSVYECQIRNLLGWLGRRSLYSAESLTPDVLDRYIAGEASRLSRRRPSGAASLATLRHKKTVIRGFLRYLASAGVIRREPHWLSDFGRTPRRFKSPPTRESVVRLIETPDESRLGLRDRAVFEVLYSTGLRRAELCALDTTDCDRSAETVRVNCGKGRKDRLVPIGKRALEALEIYLRFARPFMRPRDRSLFVGIGGRRLKPRSLNAIFRARSDEAQLLPRITPHLMRHAFASHLLENGASIRHVQAMLGHGRIETTAMYTHVTAKGLREALTRADPREAMERHITNRGLLINR